jgi:hypothetical protein
VAAQRSTRLSSRGCWTDLPSRRGAGLRFQLVSRGRARRTPLSRAEALRCRRHRDGLLTRRRGDRIRSARAATLARRPPHCLSAHRPGGHCPTEPRHGPSGRAIPPARHDPRRPGEPNPPGRRGQPRRRGDTACGSPVQQRRSPPRSP